MFEVLKRINPRYLNFSVQKLDNSPGENEIAAIQHLIEVLILL